MLCAVPEGISKAGVILEDKKNKLPWFKSHKLLFFSATKSQFNLLNKGQIYSHLLKVSVNSE